MIDPRLVFLERAAARLALIEAGVMSLEEAFAGLVPVILNIADCPAKFWIASIGISRHGSK
jgi:hypothetical protein